MAQIDITRTSNAIGAGLEGKPCAPSEFTFAIENFPNDDRRGYNFIPGGLIIANGSNEALPALVRAYENLKEKPRPNYYTEIVSEAIQSYAQFFPTGQRNICFAHFLFHGLMLNSAEDIATKIKDNGRIMRESEECRDQYVTRFDHYREVAPKYTLALRYGAYDDYAGLSMHLECSMKGTNVLMAKIGFLVDKSNEHAYVINVQGRRVERMPECAELIKLSKDKGREYARFSALYGDPRAFLLKETIAFFNSEGIQNIFAIRADEHLMAIGRHKGFRGNYDHIFAAAEMKALNQTYYLKSSIDDGR